MAKKRIEIDPDIHEAAKDYIEKQLETMRKFESAPTLTAEAFDELVYKVAAYPQQIRDLEAKSRKKKRVPHAACYEGLEGSSLLCNFCNQFEYIEVAERIETVTCSKCKHTHVWAPLSVLCAAPAHNDNTGCTNPACFKFTLKEEANVSSVQD